MRLASRASAVRFALRSVEDGVGIGGSVAQRWTTKGGKCGTRLPSRREYLAIGLSGQVDCYPPARRRHDRLTQGTVSVSGGAPEKSGVVKPRQRWVFLRWWFLLLYSSPS